MSDLLVKLYDLPDTEAALVVLEPLGISVRAALPTEGSLIRRWVLEHFNDSWAEAAAVAARRDRPSCYLAVERDSDHRPKHPYDRPEEILIGFACYDADAKGMFGPIGVRPDRRNNGIGTAMLQTLNAMKRENYAYAVIGWAGPVHWYERTVGARVIEDSEPGIFGPKLRISDRVEELPSSGV